MAKRPEIKMKALRSHMSNSGALLREDAEYVLYSEQEALQHVMKGLGERLSPEAPKEEAEEEGSVQSSAPVPESEPWNMILEPEMYLQKYGPDAKHSAQARAEIARRKADAEKTNSPKG